MTGSSQDEQTQKLPVLTRTVTQSQPEVVYPEGTVKKPMGALVRFGCWVVVVLCALIVVGAIPDVIHVVFNIVGAVFAGFWVVVKTVCATVLGWWIITWMSSRKPGRK